MGRDGEGWEGMRNELENAMEFPFLGAVCLAVPISAIDVTENIDQWGREARVQTRQCVFLLEISPFEARQALTYEGIFVQHILGLVLFLRSHYTV